MNINKYTFKEKRLISKTFCKLFFTYGKDIAVLSYKKDKSIIFAFTVSNFYPNSKSRDFNIAYEREKKRFCLYSKSSKNYVQIIT